MKIIVPTIACDVCIQTLTQAIQKLDAAAMVTGDVTQKTLEIETQVSEAKIKAAIAQVGHEYS